MILITIRILIIVTAILIPLLRSRVTLPTVLRQQEQLPMIMITLLLLLLYPRLVISMSYRIGQLLYSYYTQKSGTHHDVPVRQLINMYGIILWNRRHYHRQESYLLVVLLPFLPLPLRMLLIITIRIIIIVIGIWRGRTGRKDLVLLVSDRNMDHAVSTQFCDALFVDVGLLLFVCP